MNVGNDSRNQTRCWSRYKLILEGGGMNASFTAQGKEGER